MNKIILETKKIKKVFEHKNGLIELFKNVNITIRAGELVALIGPSGSGKSTFLHLLALLENQSSGKIILLGKDSKKIDEQGKNNIRQKNISIIFQNNNLLTDFTALENILMPLIIRGENLFKSKIKAKKILTDVKLDNRANHFPSELSGGEQQRVAIARALINNPELIIADEPTGNLDPETSEKIMTLLKSVAKNDKTVIMATHDFDIINKFPGRIVKFENKKIQD